MKNTLIKPLRGLRPSVTHAADVIAPPYDVIDRQRARELARDNPYSFLHVSKPEIDLPDTVDPYDQPVYQLGTTNFQQLQQNKILEHEDQPCYYLYQIQMGEHVQTGLVAIASVAAYQQQRIARHELTMPIKEDDRVNNILALQAQASPVLTTFRSDTALANLLTELPSEVLYEVTDQQQVLHRLLRITDPAVITNITTTAEQLTALYIADGHHRSAAAVRVYQQLKTPESAYFLTVLFPENELIIEGYHRFINDISPYDTDTLLATLTKQFIIEPIETVVLPDKPYQFAMYLAKQWYQLTVKQLPVSSDVIASLDVSVLSNTILQPLFNITDPRRDKRLQFIGGKDSLSVLAKHVDHSTTPAAAFALPPTQISQLLAVADQQQVMPPKSTWFSPKLVDGLISYTFKT